MGKESVSKIMKGGNLMTCSKDYRCDYKCIKVPVVVGVGQTQCLLVNEIELGATALDILDVITDVKIDSLHICKGKVIFNATLHKEIIFKEDETHENCNITRGPVRHVSVDIPFDGFVLVDGACPDDDAQVEVAEIDDDCEFTMLIDDNEKVQEKAIVTVCIKVTREQQISVKVDPCNNACQDFFCPEPEDDCDNDC